MERFFIVKDQRLIGEYEKYKEMLQAMNKCFKDFAEKHGIEAEWYYPSTRELGIVATKSDLEKFGSQIKKGTDGLFRANSKMAKEWVTICKENNLETPRKPTWIMVHMIGESSEGFQNRFRSRMFDLDGVVYGSYQIDRDWELSNTEAFQEMKASEFWKIVESAKERSEE